MRVLVAGRNAKVLAITASTFATDLNIDTAASRTEAMALLERVEFDVVIACERLEEGSGLEVLSRVAANTPNTLRIFAARPATLELLKGELGVFGLFRTLPYPINFRKLWAALNLARSCRDENLPPFEMPKLRHLVIEASSDGTGPMTIERTPEPRALRNAQEQASQLPAPVAPTPEPNRVAPPARIPESEAFKRALARRNAARLEASAGIRVPNLDRSTSKTAASARPRREPALNTTRIDLEALTRSSSLSELRALPDRRPRSGRRSRTALLVGSGVLAAATATVLTVLSLGSSNTNAQAPLPLIASATHGQAAPMASQEPAPTPPQQPAPAPEIPAAPVQEPPAPPVEQPVQAAPVDSASEYEPAHPGPPQPMGTPPPPMEPPAVDWTGQVPAE